MDLENIKEEHIELKPENEMIKCNMIELEKEQRILRELRGRIT